MATTTPSHHLRRIRIWLFLFIIGLVHSGITAFPLEQETAVLNRIFHVATVPPPSGEPALHTWLRRVHNGIVQTNQSYPFMAYGTDWLAFAHLVIAIAFIGPLINPVRNKWCSSSVSSPAPVSSRSPSSPDRSATFLHTGVSSTAALPS